MRKSELNQNLIWSIAYQIQSYMVVEYHVSPSRMRRLKAVLSSLSNFIEDMLDEDYPQFRNTVNRTAEIEDVLAELLFGGDEE